MLPACLVSVWTRACQPVSRWANQHRSAGHADLRASAPLQTKADSKSCWYLFKLHPYNKELRCSNFIYISRMKHKTVTKTWGFKVPLWGSDHKKRWAIPGWDGRNGVWTINILIKLWDTSFFPPNNLYTRREAARSCTFTVLLPHSRRPGWRRGLAHGGGEEACRPRYGRAWAQGGL